MDMIGQQTEKRMLSLMGNKRNEKQSKEMPLHSLTRVTKSNRNDGAASVDNPRVPEIQIDAFFVGDYVDVSVDMHHGHALETQQFCS